MEISQSELARRFIEMPLLEAHQEIKRMPENELQRIAQAGAALLVECVQNNDLLDKVVIDHCEKLLLMMDNENAAVEVLSYLAVILLQHANHYGDTLAFGFITGSLGETMNDFTTGALDNAMIMGVGDDEAKIDNRKLQKGIDETSALIDACIGHVKALRSCVDTLKNGLWTLSKEPEEIEAVNRRIGVLEVYYDGVSNKLSQFRKFFDDMVSDEESKASAQRKAEAAEPVTPWTAFKQLTPDEVCRSGCEQEHRAEFLSKLTNPSNLIGPNDFEKLLWLGGSTTQIAGVLPSLSSAFRAKKPAGWLGDRIETEWAAFKNPPSISPGGFGFFLLMLIALAGAAAIFFLPAVAVFFEGWSKIIMAVLAIAFFLLGLSLSGSIIVGGVLFVAWAGVTYLINKVIQIDAFFRIIAGVLVLVLAVFAFVSLRSRRKAKRRSRIYREEYMAKHKAQCGELDAYVDAVISRLHEVKAELSSKADPAASACEDALTYYAAVKNEIGKLRSR